eukprot:TRINITY_DN14919_c0_g1_i1.p1 TRINITY_DN14919_c0_g1~~TRINITY_DN14919_c0_g1_i1.p1  ORF type:complete len:493 (+),score=96.03 TRINITY_DN14919_c0_g1_i1:35-1513(+)
MKKTGIVLAVAVILVAVAWIYYVDTITTIGCGYAAKLTCSAVFVSNRTIDHIYSHEFNGMVSLLTKSYKIDTPQEQSIVTEFWPLAVQSRKAVYKGPNCGCFLVPKVTIKQLTPYPDSSHCNSLPPKSSSSSLWPHGDQIDPQAGQNLNVDMNRLRAAIDSQFDYTPTPNINTFALVVIYKNQLILERYSPNITPHTPLQGWSMTKSLTNTLVGIRSLQNKINVSDVIPFIESRPPLIPDQLYNITIDDALRMNTGLQWRELYVEESDATRMLLINGDVSHYVRTRNRPNLSLLKVKQWQYNSGNTNLACWALRQTFSSDEQYWRFPREELFNKLGMNSAVIEMDQAGTFVGSSFSYVSARDWAKWGLLYLNGGKWTKENGEEERILSEEWVRYSVRATNGSRGLYGAGFWLAERNFSSGVEDQMVADSKWHESLPKDSFYAHGFEEQTVMIVPSRELVVVRLGITTDAAKKNWDRKHFWGEVIASLNYNQK